jgi:hypothetical protein
MNTICPYCGEPLHFSVIWVDTVVPCGHCGREFLLSNRPRDEVPKPTLSPAAFRNGMQTLAKAIIFPFRFLLDCLIND